MTLPMKSIIKYKTACGGVIVIPPKTYAHLDAHPGVMHFLPEAINKIVLPENRFLSAEIDLGRVIGKDSRVTTAPCDEETPILFAQRKERDMPSRVAPEGTVGEDTTNVAVLAFPSRNEQKTYVLVTSWVGLLAPKEPWDPKISSQEEYQKCLKFWCSNALIHDPTVMGPIYESTWRRILENR